MFKAKEFKELIGFNHTKLVIVSVLVTGISFPYIFLGDEVTKVNMQGVNHAFFGWLFSAILHLVNLAVFYRFKKHDGLNGTVSTLKLFFTRNYPVHFVLTVAITAAFSYGPFQTMGFICTNELLIKDIVGTTILMSVIVGFYETAYYMKALNSALIEKERLRTENVEAQLELLKSQVQPHFLFNSLNTLASIIPDEPEHSVRYVQNLSKVYRYIIEIKDKKLISLKDELECVSAYLFMLETRFGKNLRCQVNSENFQPTDFIVPLSMQMLIENAVKHNTVSEKRPLTIQIKKSGTEVIVSNNLQLKDQEASSTKTGLENISSRYDLIAKKRLRVRASKTSFSVHLPIIYVEND